MDKICVIGHPSKLGGAAVSYESGMVDGGGVDEVAFWADIDFRNSLKRNVGKQDIDWAKEPCAYECAYDLDGEHIFVEDSVRSNFWIQNNIECETSNV